jgi:hypothetical protein
MGMCQEFLLTAANQGKKKKENFWNMVRTCISQQVLTVERVRKFS